jgi:predicted amidohydrolase YtcJ
MGETMGYASLVLKSGAVFTGDGSLPAAGGVAIADGKVLAVGDDAALEPLIGPDTDVRDYGNRLIMPGFNDCHTHFLQGALYMDEGFCCMVGRTETLEECLAKLRAYADAHPDNEWVFGAGVMQLSWPVPEMPTAAQIDAVIPDRPVVLGQAGLHTYSANTAAMRKANVTRDTPDPFGGEILRDAEGNPTGVFSNSAANVFTQPIFSPAREVLTHAVASACETTKRLGITSVSCLYPEYVGTPDPYASLADLDRAGELPLRASFYTSLMGDDILERIARLQAEYNTPGSNVTCNGFKILIDGVTSDHTAWLWEPYANDPSTAGQPAMDLDAVRANALKAIEAGYPVRIHTIGDRSVSWAIDLFEEARRRYGDKGLRHVQEHLELMRTEDIARLAELGIVPCVQPMHIPLEIPFASKEAALGMERVHRCWPFRSLADAGATLAFSTDFPVVELDPLHGVFAAVTRQDLDGRPPEGWVAEQRVTLAEALKAYTYGSAYCEGMEGRLGTLAPGKAADVIVLSRNLFDVEPADYLDATVELTVFAGDVVYEA